MTNNSLVFIVNHAAFFVSHRLPLAIAARDSGFKVTLLTGQAGSKLMEDHAVAQLNAINLSHKRTLFRSSGMNPFIEFVGLLQLIWFLFKLRPTIVHCASPKGVLYGGIAARLCKVHGVVLAISGMGYAFTDSLKQGLIRKIIKWVYGEMARFAFYHPNIKVIVQNMDDFNSIAQSGLVDDTLLLLIPGSGVDLSIFKDCNPIMKKKVVLLPGRMLKDKGIQEFVEAAYMIRDIAPDWRFILAGAAGYDNPTAIKEATLLKWNDTGVVEWLGHINDMAALYKDAAIVCLPSYREGMPKALLEAAAASCAVVTTDVIGCRDAIESGVTGDLVPVRDSQALALAILELIRDDIRRYSYGDKGRERALKLFSIESVVNETIKIYKGLLDE